MAIASFLALFLVYHLPFLHSARGLGNNHQSTCPRYLDCKGLGLIEYPFTNTTYPQCGMFKLNCTEPIPKILLGEQGRWYDVVGLLLSLTVPVHDQVFQRLLDNQSCDSFGNLPLPDSPHVYRTSIPDQMKLFKCMKNQPHLTQITDEYFNGLGPYYSYKKCTNHDLYYGNPNDYPRKWNNYNNPNDYPHNRYLRHPISNPSKLPLHCSVIWLPFLPPNKVPNGTRPSELFKLLTAEYSIELNIHYDCINCHRRGGQCLNYKHGFHCANAKVWGRRERRKNWILILCTVIPGAVFILITGFYFSARMVYRRYRKNGIEILINVIICFRSALALIKSVVWRKKTESYLNVETFLMNYGALNPKRYCYLDIKKMTTSFNLKLGQGGYGCVYKGMLNGIPVAVKVLNKSKGNGEEFINEVASISRTSHVNVVALLGFCFEGRKRALIYEFMPNGSLDKFITDGSSLTERRLGWEKLHQIAVGIARGLEYLHRGCNTRILHFDIKPHNILLDEDFCPKISDFGLARLCPRKESIISMLTARGTIGYIAPEVFCKNFGGVSHKSDVYSYGMMVLEMVGVRKSVKVEANQTSEIYFPDWIYQQLEIGELGLLGIMNKEESERARKMVIVSLWCIQTNPSSRPSMTRVVEMLEGSLESLSIPPKPFMSSPSVSQADSASIEIT